MSEGNERSLVATGTDETLEAGALAYEMARSYRRYVDFYRTAYGVSAAEADAKGQELLAPSQGGYDDHARHGPPQDASWHDLEYLTQNDPEAAAARWLKIKQAARDELQIGYQAAKVMEGYRSHPWRRAQFLAIRSAFIEEWRPAGGIELALIDTMAQAHRAYQQWMETLATYTSVEFEKRKLQYERDGYMEPPRVSAHMAIEEAAQMADRFNRLFLRTLRQLRDLRRYTPAVTIESAGQVNIGGQQINVARGDEAR